MPVKPKYKQPSEPTVEPGLKSRLVSVSRALLEREGLDALTLRAAARDAGVSHMAPYRHFAEKDALIAAVAAQGFRELTAQMRQSGAGQSHEPPGNTNQRLTAGIAYVTFALDNQSLYRLMFGSSLHPRDRFPELVAAGREAFECCNALSGSTDSSVGLWSIVHGLSCLAIDGLVTLPLAGAARSNAIAAILTSELAPANPSAKR